MGRAAIYRIRCDIFLSNSVAICFLFANGVRLDFVAMIVFCQCGSDRVDIVRWDNRRARVKCFTCEEEAWLDGLTLGKLDFVEQLFGAILDQARKSRRRNPEEREKLLRQRREGQRAGR